MVLTVHLLTGAALASKIQPAPLALVLAFLSHYFLDFLPHPDYSIKNIKKKRWNKSYSEFLKVGVDICFGVLLIFIFSKNQPIIYAGAFSAILADGFTLLGLIFSNNFLRHNDNFHEKIHFLKHKKISPFWGIFSQVAVTFLAIFFLLQPRILL